MATKSNAPILPLLLSLVLAAAFGFAAHSFITKYSLNLAANESEALTEKAEATVAQQISEWKNLHQSKTSSVKKQQSSHRIVIQVTENGIRNLAKYSFGEQALLTKANTSVKPISEFVIAGSDLPEKLKTSPFVFATASKINSSSIVFTRTSITALKQSLNNIVPDHISLMVKPENSSIKNQLLQTSPAYPNQGTSKPVTANENWVVSSSYKMKPSILSPLVAGIVASVLSFFLCFIPLFMMHKRKIKNMPEPAVKPKKRTSNSVPIATDNLPLSALSNEDTTQADNTTLFKEKTIVSEPPLDTNEIKPAKQSIEQQNKKPETATNQPASSFDTITADTSKSSPLLEDDLLFADEETSSAPSKQNTPEYQYDPDDDLDLDFLESEIKSKEEDVAKYRSPNHQDLSSANHSSDNQSSDNHDDLSLNNTMEFVLEDSEDLLKNNNNGKANIPDPKTRLADAELDDANIISFDSQMQDSSAVQTQITPTASSASASGSDAISDSNEQAPVDLVSRKMKRELNKNLSITPNDALKDSLFRVYDIRGNADDITEDFIEHFAYAFCNMMQKSGQTDVVVGHDVRSSSERIFETLVQSLLNFGLNVTQIGMVTSPILAFASHQTCNNGIMVTASHCPSNQNGFKWHIQNLSPSSQDVINMKKMMSDLDIHNHENEPGELTRQSFDIEYKEAIQQDIMLAELPTICIDCLHGATGVMAPSILEDIGTIAIPLNYNTDGKFLTGNPNPSEPNRLTSLASKVIENKADMGFAFDADGDRLCVVDDKGRVASPEQLTQLFAMFLLESHQSENIIIDSKFSRVVSKTISESGGVPITMPTGSSHMRNQLINNKVNAVFFGEFSGHYLFNDDRFIAYDDAVYAAARLLEYVMESGSKLSALLDKLPSYIGTPDIYITMPSQHAALSFISKLINEWNSIIKNDKTLAQHMVLNTIDGFRLDTNHSFCIIRSSNTKSAVTIRIAAKNIQEFEKLRTKLTDIIIGVNAGIASKIKSIPSPEVNHVT